MPRHLSRSETAKYKSQNNLDARIDDGVVGARDVSPVAYRSKYRSGPSNERFAHNGTERADLRLQRTFRATIN